MPDSRFVGSRAGIEFHYAGQVRNRFDTGEGENYAHELHPDFRQTCMARFEKLRGEMRSGQGNQADNDEHRWEGQDNGEASRVFRSEPINKAKEEQENDRGQGDMVSDKLKPADLFHSRDHIGQSGPTAQRSCYS